MGDATSQYSIQLLDRSHDRESFCCGNPSLDDYLKHQASQDARRSVAAPFVLTESGSGVVMGYYTLSMTGIDLTDMPESVAKILPKYPVVPATLLGRLAVDQACRGKGLGELLLFDALKRSLKSEIAWVAVVVDAIDEQAKRFYARYGFIGLPDRPLRLFMLKKTIEQAIERI